MLRAERVPDAAEQAMLDVEEKKLVNGRPWRESDDAELRRLRAEGLTSAAIGAAIGRTTQACRRRGQRLRLPAPPGWTADEIAELDRLRAAGETWGSIGAELGRSEQRRNRGRARTGGRAAPSGAAPGRRLTTASCCTCTLRYDAPGDRRAAWPDGGRVQAAHERAVT